MVEDNGLRSQNSYLEDRRESVDWGCLLLDIEFRTKSNYDLRGSGRGEAWVHLLWVLCLQGEVLGSPVFQDEEIISYLSLILTYCCLHWNDCESKCKEAWVLSGSHENISSTMSRSLTCSFCFPSSQISWHNGGAQWRDLPECTHTVHRSVHRHTY